MNIRIVLAIVVSLFLFQLSYAQDTTKPVYIKDTTQSVKKHPINTPTHPRDGYVTIAGGLGMPTGPFAANASAATGAVLSLSAAFPGIVSRFGIAFKFDYGFNGINQSQFLSKLNSTTGYTNIGNYADTFKSCSYKTFLTGLYLTYPGKHLTIDVRFLMGAMIAALPSISVSYYNPANQNSGIYSQYETTGTAFAIDFGIEARYPIKPKLSLFLSADYLHAAPSFTSITTNAAVNSDGSSLPIVSQESTISQSFNLFNLSLGMGYIIAAKNRL